MFGWDLGVYDNERLYFRTEDYPDISFWLCDGAVAINDFYASEIEKPYFTEALANAFKEQRRYFSVPDRTREGGRGFYLYPFKFKLDLDFDRCIIEIVEHPNMESGETNKLEFVKLCEHERIVKEAREQAIDELSRLVDHHVQRGVESGVAKAVHAEATTLKQVRAERETIEAQRAELERKLARLNEAEKRIEDREKAKREKVRPPADPSGFVYFVHAENGYYKIGKAKDPNNRVETFGVKLPFDIKIEHTIKCKNYHEAERHFHNKYADKRVGGEWFALTPEDVNEIKQIKEM